MKKLSKRLFSSLLGLVMLFALLPSTALAANWNPTDEITITVRVFDQSTGNYYVVGTDTCTKGDQYIQSDAYKIPQLTEFVDESKFGSVVKVVGNWYFPSGDSSQGATVYWSCNSSTATMTYWVTTYNPAGSSSGGTTQPGGTVPSNAIWTFYLKYDLAGGSNSDSFPMQSYGATSKYEKSHTFSTHTVTPVRDGYVFKYWQQTGSVNTTRTLGEDTLVTAVSISGYSGGTVTDTLTAVWEKVDSTPATSVTITYIDQGDTYATMTAFVGDTMTAIDNTKSKDGYTFKGWDTSSDAETVVYKAGASFVVNGNTTLYAVWTKNPDPLPTYTVTYMDGVAGEEVFSDQVYSNLLSGTATPAFNGTPTREGYVFKGWTPEVANTVTANATYTAVWGEDKNNNGTADDEENKYTVTYTDGVAGEEVFSDQVYSNLLSGTATPAFNGTPTREGYVFKGWTPEVANTVTADVTYTAVWGEDKNNNGTADDEENKYTVTYTDGVAGEKVFEDQITTNILAGTTTPAFNGTPTRDGYIFKGWAPTVSDVVTEDVVYVAQWEKVESSVTPTESGDSPSTGSTTNPETGDTSSPILWVSLLVISSLGLISTLIFKRKRIN